jgi:hypothetical protein
MKHIKGGISYKFLGTSAFRCSDYNFASISRLSNALYTPTNLVLNDFITLKIFGPSRKELGLKLTGH